jgi:ribosome maturation factor RimP
MAGVDLAGRIAELVRPTIEAMGYRLVRVQVLGRQQMRVQIMAEPADGRAMGLDDCAGLSRSVSAVLDVADPIRGAYTLEMSSPGIDRPLVSLDDYTRFAGFEARVELARLIEGRRRVQGRLLGVDAGVVRIALAEGEMRLPYADILRGKLVLTDALLAAHGVAAGEDRVG